MKGKNIRAAWRSKYLASLKPPPWGSERKLDSPVRARLSLPLIPFFGGVRIEKTNKQATFLIFG